MGLLGTSFAFAAEAIAESDPGNSALAHSYNLSAVEWIKTYGYWPLRKGMYHWAQFVNCQAPISDDNTFCTAGNNESRARTLSAETLRGIGLAYLHTGDPSLKEFGDNLYSAMFSKPGKGGPNPDGYYVSDLDDETGSYMVGTPPLGKSPKWFGVFFGIGDLSSWPAIRLAGPTQRHDQNIAVGFAAGAVPNGSLSRITVTAPSGKETLTVCSTSPCGVTVDPRQGAHLMRMEYLAPDGAIAASSESTILAVH